MHWRILGLAGAILAGLGAAGCLNSEADYQALLEDNNALSAELAEARQENEILSRALDNIKREQETLQLLLGAGKSNLAAARIGLSAADGDPAGAAPAELEASAPPRTPPPPPPLAESGRIYVTRPGDVLTNIAQAQRTTVARILELNPQLRNRRNYMIYDNERLRLP